MIKVSPKEFTEVWNVIMDTIISKRNGGRGMKTLYKGKDVLFMLHTVLMNDINSDLLKQMFKVKGSTF